VGQLAALLDEGRFTVEIDGKPVSLGESPTEAVCGFDGIGHDGIFERDERDDINGADPRVHALLLPHVDHLQRLVAGGRRAPLDVFRRSDESDYRPVVVSVGADIEQAHPADLLQGSGDRIDFSPVLSLTEVRDTLQYLHARSRQFGMPFRKARPPTSPVK
jgi:hypothetical protein